MIDFTTTHKRPIQNKNNLKYRGISFDGCFFYLTDPSCYKIIKYDKCFCEVECFETCKSYTCICYDSDENCFWAAAAECCYKLFKLDKCFCEIDFLTIHPCRKHPYKNSAPIITGVSCDCHHKRLVVAFPDCIISINKIDEKDCEIIKDSCHTWNMGVLSVSPSYITTKINECNQYISIYNCDFKLICKLEVSKEYYVEAIVFDACTERCSKNYHFYILATKKGCYSYIINWEVDVCDLDICDCNYKICKKNCNDPLCPDTFYRDKACTDIIESVALIETALSHILNAEGEKLQKAIASTDDIDKILCANKSINETVVNVTHLEIMLHDKLAAIKEICCECKENFPCDGHDNICECDARDHL